MKKTFFASGFLLLVLLSAACGKQPVLIEGTAMTPTLNDGDRVLMDQNLGELKRGEIVIFLYPKDRTKSYLKRIIGLPGETVEIRQGKVFINGQFLEEPYLDEQYNQMKQTFEPRMITENQYFVLGDNRDNSSDSRYWGALDRELIRGKYYMTYSKAGN